MARVGIEDIQKLVYHWPWMGCSGIFFLDGVMDFHPNLLTMKEFGLSTFGVIYREVLHGKNVDDGIKALRYPASNWHKRLLHTEFNTLFKKAKFSIEDVRTPTFDCFFHHLREVLAHREIPSKLEWFKAMYLAYNLALDRNFDTQKSLAIFFNMHTINWPTDDAKQEMKDIFNAFSDLRVVTILRSQLSMFGSATTAGEVQYHGEYDFLHYFKLALDRTALYLNPDDPWLNKRGVIRFEDLKLYPEETTRALCKFLDIPWDTSMLNITANGERRGYQYGGTTIKNEWDTKAVYNLHLDRVSILDYYRLELFKGEYYRPWGYVPHFYHGEKYTWDEIKSLYALPFKSETIFHSPIHRALSLQSRKEIETLIQQIYEGKRPELVDGGGKIPVPWIRPEVGERKLFS